MIRGTKAGRITPGAIREQLMTAIDRGISGALRLRDGIVVGGIWFVRGEIAHALTLAGERATEGMSAMLEITSMQNGTYYWEDGSLPPARSIRVTTGSIVNDETIWGPLPGSDHSLVQMMTDNALVDCLAEIRRRVPGLDSISVGDRTAMVYASETDPKSRAELEESWFGDLKCADSGAGLLLVSGATRSLLVMDLGDVVLRVKGSTSTSPESLLWAGEESKLRIGIQAVDTSVAKIKGK